MTKKNRPIIHLFLSIFLLYLCLAGSFADTVTNNPFSNNDKMRTENLMVSKNPINFSFNNNRLSQSLQDYSNDQNEKSLEQNHNKNKYLVKFNDLVDQQEIFTFLSTYEYRMIGYSTEKLFLITINDIDEFALSNSGIVESIEIDQTRQIQITPSDPYYNYQWALPALNMTKAWDVSTGSNSVYVAVIDSGIYRNHPDLVYSDIRNGWDYIFEEYCNWDSVGHGTNVTGIIGATTNNSIGISGMNWNVAIVPLRVVWSDGSIYISDVISAIYDAADLGCNVINLSLGSTSFVAAENSAIQYALSKGCIVVSAAGNDGTSSKFYPASYSGVLSVASVDSNLIHSYFSQYNDAIDVSAPGQDIFTTSSWLDDGYDYVYADGTSFSAPYVSGLAALSVATNPSITPAKFENLLKTTSIDLGQPGFDIYYGHGLINPAKLLYTLIQPSAPTGLMIHSVSDKSIVLSWNPIEEYDLYSYQLEYKNNTSTTWSYLSIPKTSTNYVISNLINGVKYDFRIKAKNTLGYWSPYSEIVQGSPLDNVAPPIPIGLKVTSVNDKQVTLGWTAVSAADLAGYNLEYKADSSETWLTHGPLGKVTATTITGLENGTSYSFRIS
ncbi:S8 family serine peptidase, partial [Acidaminobacter sp.]|uniref:S8 family serine peptidase n=1 Tax=Acidaminobacter sp. TaxID=1872102 RepID=UPI0025637BC0